jgi:hypothetical protein
MDPKPQRPSLLFSSPFSLWTELAFKLWGFGKSPEKQVAVAVIPTKDAQPSPAAKAARTHSNPKRSKAKHRARSRTRRAKR